MSFSDRTKRGFSMLELIAALLVAAILSLIAIPRISNMHAGLVSEAQLLRTNLRFVQALAMANNVSDWSVRLDATGYQLLQNDALASLTFPDGSGASHEYASGVSMTSGETVLILDAFGAPDRTHVFTLADGEQELSVKIYGFTGLIP